MLKLAANRGPFRLPTALFLTILCRVAWHANHNTKRCQFADPSLRLSQMGVSIAYLVVLPLMHANPL